MDRVLYHMYGFALNSKFIEEVGNVIRENPSLIKEWEYKDFKEEWLEDDDSIVDTFNAEAKVQYYCRTTDRINKETAIKVIDKIFPDIKYGTLFCSVDCEMFYGIPLMTNPKYKFEYNNNNRDESEDEDEDESDHEDVGKYWNDSIDYKYLKRYEKEISYYLSRHEIEVGKYLKSFCEKYAKNSNADVFSVKMQEGGGYY